MKRLRKDGRGQHRRIIINKKECASEVVNHNDVSV
jgi:hypothetical protein